MNLPRLMKRDHKPGESLSEVNLTPLIDVSLVLVVILLLTTPLAFESSLGLRGAQADAAAAATEEAGGYVEIEIRGEDEVRVGDAVVRPGDLETLLPSLITASRTGEVVVRCADGVSHGAFVGVLDAAVLCGAAGVAVMEN